MSLFENEMQYYSLFMMSYCGSIIFSEQKNESNLSQFNQGEKKNKIFLFTAFLLFSTVFNYFHYLSFFLFWDNFFPPVKPNFSIVFFFLKFFCYQKKKSFRDFHRKDKLIFGEVFVGWNKLIESSLKADGDGKKRRETL